MAEKIKVENKINIEEVLSVLESGEDMAGFCVACGVQHDGIEPDARECECEACGEHKVFGATQIILKFS